VEDVELDLRNMNEKRWGRLRAFDRTEMGFVVMEAKAELKQCAKEEKEGF
jgi:hypothetical protein